MQGKVETVKNQRTLPLGVAKRRLGISRMAQKVGIMGMAKRMSKMMICDVMNPPSLFRVPQIFQVIQTGLNFLLVLVQMFKKEVKFMFPELKHLRFE